MQEKIQKLMTICRRPNITNIPIEFGCEMLLIQLQISLFEGFVSLAMRNREKSMVDRMRLNVVAIPEILNIFSKSQNVSYMNDRTHFLMRQS